MRRQALFVLGALALAGCGSHHHRAAGPPPAPSELIRQTLAAAVASPGAKYEFDVTLGGTATNPRRLTATGAIGRAAFSAQIHGTFPFIFQGAAVGRDWGYLRTGGRWYGSAPHGLAKFW